MDLFELVGVISGSVIAAVGLLFALKLGRGPTGKAIAGIGLGILVATVAAFSTATFVVSIVVVLILNYGSGYILRLPERGPRAKQNVRRGAWIIFLIGVALIIFGIGGGITKFTIGAVELDGSLSFGMILSLLATLRLLDEVPKFPKSGKP